MRFLNSMLKTGSEFRSVKKIHRDSKQEIVIFEMQSLRIEFLTIYDTWQF